MAKKVIMEASRREATENLSYVSTELTEVSQDAVLELIPKMGKPVGWSLVGVEENRHGHMDRVTDLRQKSNSRDLWGFDYIMFSPTFVLAPHEVQAEDVQGVIDLSIMEWAEVQAEEARAAAVARVLAAQAALEAANAELAAAEAALKK